MKRQQYAPAAVRRIAQWKEELDQLFRDGTITREEPDVLYRHSVSKTLEHLNAFESNPTTVSPRRWS